MGSKGDLMAAHEPKRVLILRLSSLGDVVLSTAVLGSRALTGAKVEWVVSQEFAGVFGGHPTLSRLWIFDRKSGFQAWRKLVRGIDLSRFDEIIDLHSTWRTLWLKRVARSHGFRGQIRQLRKPRLRRWAYLLLRPLTPKSWRPRPMRELMLETVGAAADAAQPDCRHLALAHSLPQGLEGKNYWALMPSAAWPSKTWGVLKYIDLIRQLGIFPVILGTDRDRASLRLAEELRERKIPHLSGVGHWSLAQTARVLQGARAYLGSDTGLAHLAEAVGTRAYVIFGPTTPDFGFGPWRSESRSIGRALGCRPCGKDGRFCIRVWEPYACLRGLDAATVAEQLASGDAP